MHAEHVGQLSEAGPQARLHANLSHLVLVQLTPVSPCGAGFCHFLKLLQERFVRVHPEVLEGALDGQLSIT